MRHFTQQQPYQLLQPAQAVLDPAAELHIQSTLTGSVVPDQPPVAPNMHNLQGAFAADTVETEEELERDIVRLVYCDIVVAGWQAELEEQLKEAVAWSRFNKMCSERGTKVRQICL